MHNLIEFLEEICATKGDSPAVEAPDGALTFNGLRDAARRIGSYFAYARGWYSSRKMIAVYIPKGTDCLCAMMGVLYSGNVYVPLDTRAPANRTKLILDVIQAALVVTDAQGKRFLSAAGFSDGLMAEYGDIASDSQPVPDSLVTETLSRTRDTDPAYLLFTSGSTGVPKGVVIPHRRVIHYINWARTYFTISGCEVIGNQSPFYFTVSAMDIYLSQATGAKLCIIPENLFSKPDALLQFVDENSISLIFWVSSVYHHIAKADALGKVRPIALKHAWFVGEPMPAPSLGYWLNHLPDTAFANLYGATETDMVACYCVPRDHPPNESVPLGYPCANTEILILNDGVAARPNEIGEICVRGSCLALGYYKDAEKTATGFIQNPLHNDYPDILYKTGDLGEMDNGRIIFHGRKDHQFKHLGYRIEAGEIEAVAARFAAVKNTCVLYNSEKRQIVLFYESDGSVDETAYRRALMAYLPVYMVPTRFVRLDKMPFNANRKKDRIRMRNEFMEVGEGSNGRHER